MTNAVKVYFPGLNGLRFLAASAVIITHIELIKASMGFVHCWDEPLFFNLGGLGVYFFFVLSGFLITYLLLKEKETAGNIDIKKFYIRRILRIWPLYYFILILGFLILPHIEGMHFSFLQEQFNANFNLNLLFYIVILPNLAFSLFPAVPHIGQAWSIGVEEQFYLFWPWLISRTKNIKRMLYIFIGSILAFKVVILFIPMIDSYSWNEPLKRFVAMSKFESMAIGGWGAYLLYQKHTFFMKIIFNKYIVWFSVLFIPVLVYFTPAFLQNGIHLVYSLLFLVIIINVSSNKNVLVKLESNVLSHLGNVSFGIYMYHLIVIAVVLKFYRYWGFEFNLVGENAIIYSSVFILTIIVSFISYNFFEKRFINLKSKYTIVKSN